MPKNQMTPREEVTHMLDVFCSSVVTHQGIAFIDSIRKQLPEKNEMGFKAWCQKHDGHIVNTVQVTVGIAGDHEQIFRAWDAGPRLLMASHATYAEFAQINDPSNSSRRDYDGVKSLLSNDVMSVARDTPWSTNDGFERNPYIIMLGPAFKVA